MAHSYSSNHAGYVGGIGLAESLQGSKRAKVSARACWLCGNDARGKFCPPCSFDVTYERNLWRLRKNRKNK